jgi:radical SAM superfamily enzyme YgiQ (UPF0313 family)
MSRPPTKKSKHSSPREAGVVVKDWGGRLPVALIYPNRYYLGMSNLGVQAIYRLLNEERNIVGERVFYEPGEKRAPHSIESGRPLADFAVLAFSVSYELDYFNVAAILKAGGIPPFATDRDETYPLVIAGGPCITANPMPLSPCCDALAIGEAEAILPALLPVLSQGIGSSRDDLLKEISKLPGLYVPACPSQDPVRRQYTANLDDFATTSVVLTPDTELGDLYLIEAERGCAHGCRFCLVNTAFAPMRFRTVANLIRQAEDGLKYRKRIGLVGPAVTDHPQLKELLAGINRLGAELAVSSLRIGSLSDAVITELSRGKVRTVTIAPEAGAARLRRAINKDISEAEILRVADAIAGGGFRQLKLYFIIGLPTETDEDAAAIARLALAIKGRLDKKGGGTRLVLNVTPFDPKAGTPFQWLPMAPPEALDRRLSMLRGVLPRKGIKLNAESPAWSRVQGALARGDARLAPAIAGMENISLAGWRQAIKQYDLDIDYYVNQRWETGDKLPWDIINAGTKTEKLCGELEKALAD